MISEKRDDRPLRSGRVSIPDRVDAEILSRCRHCVPHAHDCLTARVELARQCRHSSALPEPALDCPALIFREAQGPASGRLASCCPTGPLGRSLEASWLTRLYSRCTPTDEQGGLTCKTLPLTGALIDSRRAAFCRKRSCSMLAGRLFGVACGRSPDGACWSRRRGQALSPLTDPGRLSQTRQPSGAVSECTRVRRLSVRLVPDEQAALQAEIDRLAKENAALREQLAKADAPA